MQPYESQAEINIFEIIDLLRRNLVFIFYCIVWSLLIAVLLSSISFFLNREVVKYSLSTNVSINGEDIEAEMVTIINNSLSHPSILEQAQSRLGITSSDYSVLTRRGNDSGILQLIIIGPDAMQLTLLSNEIFFLGKPLIEKAFPTIEVRKMEISTPTVLPHSTQSNVNWILNSILGIIIGGIVSVFYIFLVFFLSSNIIQDNEFETLFDSKILGRVVNKTKQKTLGKFFEVR